MKSLALLLPAMRLGGAEKIALNFIPELMKHFKVTVILNKKEGELLDRLPEGVEVIEDKLMSFGELVKYDFKHFRLIKLFRDFVYYIKIKFKKNSDKNYRYLVSRTPQLNRRFDIAIAYVANVSTQIFSCLDRTDADKKIAWIHGETTELKDVKLYTECYAGFDKIFCVSGVSRNHFVEKFPSIADKCDVYYNPINRDEIIEKAKEAPDVQFDSEFINILSVGRISPEKGFDMVPRVAKILRDKGYPVRFYIIGDGAWAPMVREQIEKKGTEDSVFLLGTKTNPHPYMKACDIYVQPSYEEGYSTTICEAGTLGCAIVGTTTSGGIREQVEDGVSALLAEPTAESIAEKIEQLINDSVLMRTLRDNVAKIDFSNRCEIQKILN